jgi:thiol-disulfide isomerase/thioredoxin
VTVHVAGSPDATLPAGLPSVTAGGTPYSLPPAPAASEIAGLRLSALGSGSTLLGDLRGTRATVVAFWATWCTPCQQEIPSLAALQPSLQTQGVRLLLVDERENASTVSSWLHDRGVATSSAWLDPDTAVEGGLGLDGMPATALLGPDGAVRDRIPGPDQLGLLHDALASMGISAQ